MANENVEKNLLFSIIALGVLGIAVLMFLVGGWYTIESGQQGILLTWGRAESGSIGPGIHFKWPIAQRVVKFDTRTQILNQYAKTDGYDTAASKDLQIVKAVVVLNYHLIEDRVPNVFTEIGPSYEDKVIIPTLHDSLKASTAKYTAEELITNRENVRESIQELMVEKMKPYHIVVEQVNIVEFDFSEDFNKAIEAKVTAEQNKLKAENDLQRIMVEAQQQVAAANGARDAAIAQAVGEAEKVRLVQEQLKQSPQYIEYVKAQKWDGHVPVIFAGAGVQPFLNVGSLIGMNQTS